MSFYAEVFLESRLTAQLWFDDFFWGDLFCGVTKQTHAPRYSFQFLHPRAPAKARPREAFRSRPSEPFRHNKADAHCPLVSRQSGGIKSLTRVSRDKPSGKAFFAPPPLLQPASAYLGPACRADPLHSSPRSVSTKGGSGSPHHTALHRQAATLDQATHAFAQR